MATHGLYYTPIPPGARKFRILTLNPSQDASAAVECFLESAFLDDPPDYEALSYVWGDPERTHSVTIDGKTVRITNNLHVALRHLRLPDRRRKLWVDALCIDQQNTDERDSQVLHMREIYQRCSVDLLWLGEDASILENGASAMETIGTITRLEKSVREDFSSYYSLEEALNEPPGDWAGILEKLFRKPPVWQRVWIMQEVSLAPRVVLVAGCATLPWERIDDFLDVDNHIAAYGLPDAFHTPFGHSWTLRRQLEYCLAHAQILAHQRRICAQQQAAQSEQQDDVHLHRLHHPTSSSSLHNILARFRYCHATDPRDRVFALLNLSSDPLSLTPTYHDPVAAVYTKAAAALINAAGNLDLLCQGPWTLGTSQQHPLRNPDLPSWVPDFANPGAFKILFAQRGIYNASGEGRNFLAGPSSSSSSSSLPVPVQLQMQQGTAGGRGGLLLDACLSVADLALVRRPRRSEWEWCECALAWMPNEVLEAGIAAGNASLMPFLKPEGNEEAEAEAEAEALVGEGSRATSGLRWTRGKRYGGPERMGVEGEGSAWGAFETYWRTLMLDCTRYPVRRLREENVKELRPKFAAWLMAPVGVKHSEWTRVEIDSEGRTRCRSKKDLAKQARDDVRKHLSQLEDWVFAILENGRYAMVPPDAEKGDKIVVLKGAKTPVVLREATKERKGNQGPMRQEWTFVGPCYVHGLMDGNAVTMEDGLSGEQFLIV
ncbi:heterokaryon incompatibility protein [Diplodia corticola]|uniref:Heterokaryon incompatibility protein n=1 Tax=Diplodia corticola TaxID=236234 RepID=A0A1J9RBG3_9PEZI|nr:heterokaryon incompatibility protein [Diplodia corticola]OJD38950.1 heterokaryon incompatibility protein [Diplodia corticola]